MNRDELEFLISQYADGTLDVAEKVALEVLLAQDGAAQALLDEYRRLDGLLKTSLPMPSLAWDTLARHISAAVAHVGDEGLRVGVAEKSPSLRRSYLMPWVISRRGKLALAASILLAVVAGIHYLSSQGSKPMGHAALARLEVTGPLAEAAEGPAINEISIGPALNLTPAQANARFADSVVSLVPRVIIASYVESGQDTQQSPY